MKLDIPQRRRDQNRLLGSRDFQKAPKKLTVKDVGSIKFPGDRENKLKINFEEVPQAYAANLLNEATMMETIQSLEVDDWLGTEWIFYFDPEVEYEGENTGGVRVIPADQDLPEHVQEYYDALTKVKEELDAE